MLLCKPSTIFPTTLQDYLYVLTHIPTSPLFLLYNLFNSPAQTILVVIIKLIKNHIL